MLEGLVGVVGDDSLPPAAPPPEGLLGLVSGVCEGFCVSEGFEGVVEFSFLSP